MRIASEVSGVGSYRWAAETGGLQAPDEFESPAIHAMSHAVSLAKDMLRDAHYHKAAGTRRC